MLKIAHDIDQERGFDSEELALPISVADVLTTLFEFNESPEVMLDDRAVLVTSCHGAKGLEFRKIIQLVDGFGISSDETESERRLFYVGMTRAKEELVLCSTRQSLFVMESGVNTKSLSPATTSLPRQMFYSDLSPGDVYLGHHSTKNSQHIITHLQEGTPLKFQSNTYNNGWDIFTTQGQMIGNFVKKSEC